MRSTERGARLKAPDPHGGIAPRGGGRRPSASWGETLAAIFSGRMLVALLMGFASGLPLLLTGSVLQAWLKDGGIDIRAIGLFALVGLPYTLKFLWSPLFDRYAPPLLGRRRGWLARHPGRARRGARRA